MAFTKITNAGFGLTTGTLVGVAASFSSTVSVGGTLTYEDVTNVDSVGLITARNGIEVTDKGVQVGTGATVDSAGDNILTFLTNGNERIRVTDVGRVLINASSDLESSGAAKLQIAHTSGALLALGRDDSAVSAGNDLGKIAFYGNDGGSYEKVAQITCEADGSHADGDKPGRLLFATTADGASSPTERLRITSSGDLCFGSTVGANNDGSGISIYNASFPRISFRNSTTGNTTADGSQLYLVNSDFYVTNNESANLIFRTDSTERMRIDSSGRMGLGATSLTRNLTVQDSSTIVTAALVSNPSNIAYLLFGDTDADAQGRVQYDNSVDALQLYSNGSERVRIDSSGRLQIGASNNTGTNTKLVVGAGNNINTTAIINTGDVDVNALTLSNWDGSTTTNKLMMHFDSSGIGAFNIGMPAATDAFVIDDGGTERLRVDSSGRLLLGTTTEGYSSGDDLTIATSGHTGITLRSGTTSEGAVYFSDATSGAGEYVGSLVYSHNTNNMVFTANGTERFRIESDGDLKFGNQTSSTANNSTALVHLDAGREYWSGTAGDYRALKHRLYYVSTDDAYGMGVSNNLLEIQSQTNIAFFSGSAGAASGRRVERMRITSSGAVLVAGTSAYSDGTNGEPKLQWNAISGNHVGAVGISNVTTSMPLILFKNPNGVVGDISSSGSATAYNTSSDYRLKENIVDITDGITRVKQLQPRRFNFIADADTTVDGFLAHEAQTVVPEAVTGTHNQVDDDNNPVYQGIDTSKLVPLLTAALQEEIAKREALEARIAALEG